jgi:hypothetical protein
MLEAASSAPTRGSLEAWVAEDVAAALDLDPEQVEAIREAMEGKTVKDGGLPSFTKRNPKREDGSAERARAWRQSKKNAPEPPEPNGNGKRTQPNATERNRTLEEIREEKRTTTDSLPSEARLAPRSDESAPVIDLAERRPSEPPAPPDQPPLTPAAAAAAMMPWVRTHFRMDRGWPGRTAREQRQQETRCLAVLRELLEGGTTPQTVAEALRGAVILRDSGKIRGWVAPGQPMFTRILNHTSESGPSFWQRCIDAYRRTGEEADGEGGSGGLQPVVVDVRGAA